MQNNYCYRNPNKISKELKSFLINPFILENFNSGVNPTDWLKSYIINKKNPINEKMDKTYYTIKDKRLLPYTDDYTGKKYLIFYKDDDKIIVFSLDDKKIHTITYNPSQIVKDIVHLQQFHLSSPEQINLKNEIYDKYWDKLDSDAQLLKTNDITLFKDNSLKSTKLNKIILELASPITNPFLIENFDSGLNLETIGKEEAYINTNIVKVTLPPELNDDLYKKITGYSALHPHTYTERNDYFDVNNEEDITGDFKKEKKLNDLNTSLNDNNNSNTSLNDNNNSNTSLNDNKKKLANDLNNLIENDKIIIINKERLPAAVLKKNDDEIVYYNPDTGDITRKKYDYNKISDDIQILKINEINKPEYNKFEKMLNDFDYKLNNISKHNAKALNKVYEAKDFLMSKYRYIDNQTCLDLSKLFDVFDTETLMKLINFSECIIEKMNDILNNLKKIVNIKRLLADNIFKGKPDLNFNKDVDMTEAKAMELLNKLRGGHTDLGNGIKLDHECLFAKLMLNEKLKKGFDFIRNMLSGDYSLDDIMDELDNIKSSFTNNSIYDCILSAMKGK